MCGQCGGLQLSGVRAWMEPSSRFGLCRYGASRLLTTGEEGLSPTVLLLSWMMLMWHFFQRLNLFVGRFRSSICVTKLKEASFWQVSVVTTFCQWHAEPQVIVDVSMLPFRQCVVVALVDSLSVWCGFSWTCGEPACWSGATLFSWSTNVQARENRESKQIHEDVGKRSELLKTIVSVHFNPTSCHHSHCGSRYKVG